MLPGLHPADLATARLLSEIVEVDRGDDPFEADMKFADFTVSEGVNLHAHIGEPFVETGDVFKVARQPVNGFREHSIVLLCLRRLPSDRIVRGDCVRDEPEMAASENSATTRQPCRSA